MQSKQFIVVLPAVSLLLALPAFGTDSPRELEEIVVTASRVGEKVSDTAVTVNLIDEEEVEKVQYRNPDEILRRIPGVYSHSFGGESELSSIRIPTHFTNPYTLLLVDGVPTSSYGSGSSGNFRELNSDNIARIEVIKGPASALYGSNAIGGVINVITKKPTAEPQVKVWTELGTDTQWRSSASGSGSTDSLGGTIDLSHIDSENWRQHAEVKKRAASAKLQYTPTDSGLLAFGIDYLFFDNESPGTLNKDDFKSDWQQSYHTFAYNNLEKISSQLSYTHYLDRAELTSTVIFRSIEQDSIPNYAIRQQGPSRYVGELDESDTQDLDGQFLYSRDFALLQSKLVFGLDGERGEKDSDQYNLAVNYNRAANKYTDYTNEGLDTSYNIITKMYAPYLQYQFSPLSDLRLTAGGRYDSVTYEVDDLQDGSRSGDKDFSRFTSKLGAVYHFLPTLNMYCNYADGFVVPTTSQLLTSSWANDELDPEKAKNYEVGIRGQFFDQRLNVDLAGYWLQIEDKIIAREISAYRKEYVNTGETLQRGVELSGDYTPIDALTFSIAYTYAKNTFEEYVPGATDYADNSVPRSPEHRVNLRLAVRPLDGLDLELEADYISSQYTDDANTEEYDRPTLLHLRARYTWDKWSLWTYLENIGDEEYASYVSYSNSEGSSTYYSGSPRTLYAGLSYTW